MLEKGLVLSCASDSIAAITTKLLQMTRLKRSRERISTSVGRGAAPPFMARGQWALWAPLVKSAYSQNENMREYSRPFVHAQMLSSVDKGSKPSTQLSGTSLAPFTIACF